MFALLVAALCHNVDHLGMTNQMLVKSVSCRLNTYLRCAWEWEFPFPLDSHGIPMGMGVVFELLMGMGIIIMGMGIAYFICE